MNKFNDAEKEEEEGLFSNGSMVGVSIPELSTENNYKIYNLSTNFFMTQLLRNK